MHKGVHLQLIMINKGPSSSTQAQPEKELNLLQKLVVEYDNPKTFHSN